MGVDSINEVSMVEFFTQKFRFFSSIYLNFPADLHCRRILGPKMERSSLEFTEYNAEIYCARFELAERNLAPDIIFSQCKRYSISIETGSKSLLAAASGQIHFVFNEIISQVVMCNEFRALPARHARMSIANE